MTLRVILGVVVAACLGGCRNGRPPAGGAPPADVDVPVALNAESPFGYPPALYDQGVEGDVVLRLYVDAAGRLVAESTRIAESSGTPALDSAALAGAPGLRFAPATRRGVSIGTVFLQPVRFRRPDRAAPPPGDR